MVSPETRLPELSYSHHREISSLPPEQQKHFLQKASEENIKFVTKRKFRQFENVASKVQSLLRRKDVTFRVESCCRQQDVSFEHFRI